MILVANRRNGKRRDAIYAGRPGPFGNPFKLDREEDRAEAVEQFRAWFFGDSDEAAEMRRLAMELPAEAVLECWCVPRACHAQVIADFVNQERRKA